MNTAAAGEGISPRLLLFFDASKVSFDQHDAVNMQLRSKCVPFILMTTQKTNSTTNNNINNSKDLRFSSVYDSAGVHAARALEREHLISWLGGN